MQLRPHEYASIIASTLAIIKFLVNEFGWSKKPKDDENNEKN